MLENRDECSSRGGRPDEEGEKASRREGMIKRARERESEKATRTEKERSTARGRGWRRRNANAQSVGVTRRKKKDGRVDKDDSSNNCRDDKVGERYSSSSRDPDTTPATFSFSLSNPSLFFSPSLHPRLLSLAFHSSRSYLTVCTLRFLHLIHAIFFSTTSLFRHISRSSFGRLPESRVILLTLRASSTVHARERIDYRA